MSFTISDSQVAKLKKLAESSCWSDNPEFMVDDYAGGNIDDAFYGGSDAGEVMLARAILDDIGVEYTKPE